MNNMKRIFLRIVPIACFVGLCLPSGSCSSSGRLPGAGNAEREGGAAGDGRATSVSPEYSDNTLLLSLEAGVSEADIQDLAARYDMEVLYIYQNFNMCALRLPERLDDQRFDRLIERIEKEPGVLQAMRDGIMQLH